MENQDVQEQTKAVAARVVRGNMEWFEDIPEELLSLPYALVVNANSPIEGAANQVGKVFVSDPPQFTNYITIIPLAFGKRTEQITDRKTGEITEEPCYVVRCTNVDFGLPMVINFRRSGRRAAQDMAKYLKLSATKLGDTAFRLTPAQTENEQGKWFVFKATQEWGLSVAECQALTKNIWTPAAIAASEPEF